MFSASAMLRNSIAARLVYMKSVMVCKRVFGYPFPGRAIRNRATVIPESVRRQAPEASRRSWVRPAARLLAVVLLVLLITAPVLRNGFVNLDNRFYIDAPQVSSGLALSGLMFGFSSGSNLYWHPLAWLTQKVDFEVFGDNPMGHHFTGIFVHVTSPR